MIKNELYFYFCFDISDILILFSWSQIDKDTIVLQEHDVISAANPVVFRQISKTIHIISKEQIKEVPIVAIDELLKIYGGIDIRSRGAMGVQSDINLRGGTFDQGLIMIDGISLNDPQTGHHNLNQAIDLDDVEKIEIFEGAGTRWFDANSFYTPNGLYPYKGHNYHRTDIAGADAGINFNSLFGSTSPYCWL